AGARRRLGADAAVAVTGIAGPGGGSPGKPVALVHLHAAGPGGDAAQRLELPGDRQTVRERATVAALPLLRRELSQSWHTCAAAPALAWRAMSGFASSARCCFPARRSTPS